MNTDFIEKNILLRAPRNRVWRALSDSVEFGSWFGVEFEGPFTPGRRARGKMVGYDGRYRDCKGPEAIPGNTL